VKSNTAGCKDAPLLGSHGKSGVIDPTGLVVCEGSIYEEELVLVWFAFFGKKMHSFCTPFALEECHWVPRLCSA
jgi:hypothetical protein